MVSCRCSQQTNPFTCSELPSGYLTVRHGKSSLQIGISSISMGHLYHYQRVDYTDYKADNYGLWLVDYTDI
jgi:hypothetical protein